LKKLAATIFMISLIATPLAAHAKGAKLIGKWTVTEIRRNEKKKNLPKGMEMLVEFKKGGKMIATMSYRGRSKSKEGSWKLKGEKLVTKMGGKTDEVDYTVSAKRLKLIKKAKGKTEVMTLKKK
jgi:uncharacterized protein (TIGR03066 family)